MLNFNYETIRYGNGLSSLFPLTSMNAEEKIRHEIKFRPGHDCIRFECVNGSDRCFPGSGGSHGRHGLEMRWLVIGEKGAIQFLLFAGWTPEPERYGKEILSPPLPADLGYHSYVPMYEGQEPMHGICDVLNTICYYDGSGLNADEPFRVLCNEGGDALWAYLDAVYRNRFYNDPYPEPKPYKFAPR